MQMDDYERAKNSFISAHEVDPHSVDSNHNLGVVYGREEEFEIAERFFRRALEIKADHISSITALASILTIQERHNEAFEL